MCSIHEQEEDLYNAEIYKNNLSFRCIKSQLIDGSRAFNIYSFNDETYEYYFVGDIHSDVTSLRAVLNSCNFFNAMTKFKNIRLIFLGDYVDRGKSHLETIELVLLLKYLFPQNCYLLKGNHDGGYIDDEVVLCVKKQDNEFINILGVDCLVRGHEAVENGVKQFFNGRLYTVFLVVKF